MKPFVKWAGGKTRLLKEIEQRLPADFDKWEDAKYIEPFVGGGSVFLHILTTHKNIRRAIINDINPVLIESYKRIQQDPISLLSDLRALQNEYIRLSEDAREAFYYKVRDEFNRMPLNDIQKVSVFIFLNHTCFNGLYRENSNGYFNVPHGRYKTPVIYDEENLLSLHDILQRVEIKCSKFSDILDKIGNSHTFIYMDPPYRPINKKTKMFTAYDKSGFTDNDQYLLKDICDMLTVRGCKIMISNSDSYNEDGTPFFDSLFANYFIDKIPVYRTINPYISRNRKQTEVLITNYQHK